MQPQTTAGSRSALIEEDGASLQASGSAWCLLELQRLNPGNAVLESSRVYRFQARWACTRSFGRRVLAGEAASLMPPFAGEGLFPGLRDVFALKVAPMLQLGA